MYLKLAAKVRIKKGTPSFISLLEDFTRAQTRNRFN